MNSDAVILDRYLTAINIGNSAEVQHILTKSPNLINERLDEVSLHTDAVIGIFLLMMKICRSWKQFISHNNIIIYTIIRYCVSNNNYKI
jgi:hypothetical protein